MKSKAKPQCSSLPEDRTKMRMSFQTPLPTVVQWQKRPPHHFPSNNAMLRLFWFVEKEIFSVWMPLLVASIPADPPFPQGGPMGWPCDGGGRESLLQRLQCPGAAPPLSSTSPTRALFHMDTREHLGYHWLTSAMWFVASIHPPNPTPHRPSSQHHPRQASF